MERIERFYQIQQLLQSSRAVSMRRFIEELGVSRATINRDIEYLRDRFNAPIEWDRTRRGYRLEQQPGETPWSLPGLWFSAAEVHALLTMEALLEDLQPGLLAPHLRPLRERIRRLLGSTDHSADSITRRIRLLGMATRPYATRHFEVIASALLDRRQVAIGHYNRQSDEHTRRVVSPQRLVNYRGNWYMDAWCHLRGALRSFAVDAIESVEALDEPAQELPDETMEPFFASAYGIFTGESTAVAVLRFTPKAARWVANEQWHPQQQGRFDDAGHYLLELPYANDTELVMDILRYGPDVEVVGPPTLRERTRERLAEALAVYS